MHTQPTLHKLDLMYIECGIREPLVPSPRHILYLDSSRVRDVRAYVEELEDQQRALSLNVSTGNSVLNFLSVNVSAADRITPHRSSTVPFQRNYYFRFYANPFPSLTHVNRGAYCVELI